MYIGDPLFPQKLARLLQTRGTNPQAPTEISLAGIVITIPGDQVFENVTTGRSGAAQVLDMQAAPAAGVDPSWLVPAGQLWVPIAVQGVLTTSAVAFDRNVHLLIERDAGQGIYARIISPAIHQASVAIRYVFAIGLQRVNRLSVMQAEMPDQLTLLSNDRIRFDTEGLQGGDQWSSLSFTRG